jgi:diphthamide synthase (EF-2-diphthine--ammonia ligase)
VGLSPLFPLWGEPTEPLLAAMLRGGLRARIVCLDPTRVSRTLAGRELDASLVAELPGEVDRCGERGEFHTFVTAGPMLRHQIAVQPGQIVERDGFVFADLLPADTLNAEPAS